MALTLFELGKLKIAAHVREELDRVGIAFESISCRSGGIETHPHTARLTVVSGSNAVFIDFSASEVESCEYIVAGEVWHKIAAFVTRLS